MAVSTHCAQSGEELPEYAAAPVSRSMRRDVRETVLEIENILRNITVLRFRSSADRAISRDVTYEGTVYPLAYTVPSTGKKVVFEIVDPRRTSFPNSIHATRAAFDAEAAAVAATSDTLWRKHRVHLARILKGTAHMEADVSRAVAAASSRQAQRHS